MSPIQNIGPTKVLNVASEDWQQDPYSPSAVQLLWGPATNDAGVELTTGLFRMEPQTFDFVFPGDETVHVLDGDLDIELVDSGEVVHLETGDLAFFPGGMTTRWVVNRTTTEFFTVLG